MSEADERCIPDDIFEHYAKYANGLDDLLATLGYPEKVLIPVANALIVRAFPETPYVFTEDTFTNTLDRDSLARGLIVSARWKEEDRNL